MAAILGGGLSGLSTGYYLLKNNVTTNNNLKLFLVEATNYCGGWIKSIRTKDYVFEQGPRTIRPKGATGLNTLNMIEDLGLSEHLSPIKSDHPAAKNRMIYVNNNLHTLPSDLKSVFQKMKPFSRPLIYAVFTEFFTQAEKNKQDDTIYNFVERRFGKEIAEYAVAPMICGICAGDAKEISVKFLMKTLFEWEQNHGGVVKGLVRSMFRSTNDQEDELSNLAQKAQHEKWNVYTIKGGLDTFPRKLYEYLYENNVQMNLSQRVKEIKFIDSGSVELITETGNVLPANHVYSTIPAKSLANLVYDQHPQLAQNLREIPFVTVGIVNLYFAKKELINPAFGFLVPPIENSPILGVVFDSCCMPDQNGTVMTVMLGGRWYNEKFGKDTTKEQLFQIALREIQRILHITEYPSVYNVSILQDCIPQYIVGHYERIENIRRYIQQKNLPISLIGSSYDGVGINDVIYSARTQVNHST